MALVDVLDHGDLELPRQEDEGAHRQGDQPEPIAVALGRCHGEQPGQLGRGGGPVDEVAEPAEHPEGHVDPDRQEGHQLDERLDGDRGDHALVPFARVEVAGPERDREGREQQGHDQGGPAGERPRGDRRRRPGSHPGGGAEHLVGGRDRRELESEVGDAADHGDDGDERAEPGALAVPGGDVVGDRGDPAPLALQNVTVRVGPR